MSPVFLPRLFSRFFREPSSTFSVHLFRNSISSLISFNMDVLLLWILVSFSPLRERLSIALAFVFGMTLSYLFSIFWVYRERSFSSRYIEYGLFVLIGIIGLTLNDILIRVFSRVLGWPLIPAKYLAGITIYVYNFMARKWLLFSRRRFASKDKAAPP